MSASVRMSALSSSTTRIESGSAVCSNRIEHSSDARDVERLLEVAVNPVGREGPLQLVRRAGHTTIDNHGNVRIGESYGRDGGARLGTLEMHVQQHRDGMLGREDVVRRLQVRGDDGVEPV